MAKSAIDIVMTTRNRPGYLKQSLESIFARTKHAYRLHIIDDGSTEGNVNYLLTLFRKRKIASLLLRDHPCGLRAARNVGFWLAFSDPVVFTDDDGLCPDVNPDWLTRGLHALHHRPKLGMLALNAFHSNPGRGGKGARDRYRKDDQVTYCRCAHGLFLFIRRKVLLNWSLPHVRGQPVVVKGGKPIRPNRARCNRVRELGFEIGYLTNTYTYHFGETSVRPEKKGRERMIKPVDMKTLRPPKKWAW